MVWKMKIDKILNLTRQGHISKRACWQIMRDKFIQLKEYQKLVSLTRGCAGIHLQNDGIVYEAEGGAKLFFDFDEMPISRAEVMLCQFEQESWEFIESLIPENGTVLDIGANVGWFTIRLANKYPEVNIYSFEPVPATYAKMKKNLLLNGISEISNQGGHVYIINAGLYDKDGESTIFVPGSSEASSLQPINDKFYLRDDNEGQNRISCMIKTMDTFVKENDIKSLDFIKCDTEGAEKMVFLGAQHVLKKLKPMVYTEMLRKHAERFGYHPNEIIEYFKEYDYDCYREENGHLIKFTFMDDRTEETNFFFLHKEKHVNVIERFT